LLDRQIGPVDERPGGDTVLDLGERRAPKTQSISVTIVSA